MCMFVHPFLFAHAMDYGWSIDLWGEEEEEIREILYDIHQRVLNCWKDHNHMSFSVNCIKKSKTSDTNTCRNLQFSAAQSIMEVQKAKLFCMPAVLGDNSL